MPDRREQDAVVEQRRKEPAARPKELAEQAQREAFRRQRIEDLIRQAKAAVTGV